MCMCIIIFESSAHWWDMKHDDTHVGSGAIE